MADESILFTYVAPFVGVLLVAVGIGGAVPGGYAIIQEDITDCDEPTIAVEGAEESPLAFNETAPNLTRLRYEDLAESEQAAFRSALEDPVGEARVAGPFPNRDAFQNGTIVTYEGERHYVTVVAENPCFVAPALQFPLGVFAIIFGVVGILTPPIYRKLIELEERANVE
ncbi:hypothetical protein [Haloarcula onubensis]|uniref:DUF7979 domain-containing protein n=1 Tax=Haloarcula onubensis TaxID=2950539 RepID=A0ABU2FR38_9EURY|nr:hypothetical protein [Halomicroarcula sp. S3CR25-11]MDS0283227.1 hypothetical protein [Halomicroarcula sp. S3CR25-11]